MVEQEESMSDDEAILKIAQAMKSNASTPEEKQSIHVFLHNVAVAEKTTKVGNLQVDKDINELGVPFHNVRGCFDMALISDKIMENEYFKDYFTTEAESVLATSLSREGFLIRQATTQTKAVADITKRRSVNKGWFGKKKVTETGGDPYGKENVS